MYLQKLISKKTLNKLIFCWQLTSHCRKKQDPQLLICTKMSIHSTAFLHSLSFFKVTKHYRGARQKVHVIKASLYLIGEIYYRIDSTLVLMAVGPSQNDGNFFLNMQKI
jgi:hypothetical protein